VVLGNHEYFHNPKKIIEFIRKNTDFNVLLNEVAILDTLRVNIVGVTDLFGYRAKYLEPNFDKAFDSIDDQYPTILLTHQPKSIEYLGSHKPDIILSGHTHGGQIWPFNYLVSLQQPYVKGLHNLGYGGKIYINSGIGFWGPPMRLGSQAEIAYII
jgi:predicted MPP superfamily phosphohydrolase